MPDSAPESLVTPAPPAAVEARDRVTAVLEVLLCSSIPTQLTIGALLRATGLFDAAETRPTLAFVLALTLTDTVVLIALMVFLMRAHGESVRRLWLGSQSLGREIGYGLLTIPVVFIAVGIMLNAIRLVAPWLHNVPNNPLEQMAATPGEAALFALVAIFAGGVREELQRAFLLHRFEQYLGGATVGVWVLSVAFGLGHSLQGWDAVVTTGLLGAFWATMYVKRRNSVAPIVSHAGFNSLEIFRLAVIGA
jgi:membrane protease YdiL (CAAX protease family)